MVDFTRFVDGRTDVTVDADGDVSFTINGGYYGEDFDHEVNVDDLAHIVKCAQCHKTAYQLYKDRGYEDEAMYHSHYNFLMKHS
jgi:hypothetical protein